MPGAVRSIAVVVSDINQEYQSSVLSGAGNYAARHGIRLCSFTDSGRMIGSSSHDTGEYNIYQLIQYSFFDGVLMLTNTIPNLKVRQPIFDAASEAGIPTVVLDAESPHAASVCIDNYHAMRAIAEHLTDVHGCRRICYVSGPSVNPENTARQRAVEDVLSERGLSLSPELIWHGLFRSQDGTDAAEYLLRAAKETDPEKHIDFPDAIICANDIMAIAVMNTLDANHVRVPEDVLVTGFDHTFEGRNFEPELTSVERPLYNAGARAMELLCSGEATPGKKIMLQTSSSFAGSCGCTGCTASSLRDFKTERFRQMDHITADTRLCNRMSCAFAECETPEAMMDVLGDLAAELNCEGFYICLNSDWDGALDSVVTDEYEVRAEEFRTSGFPETMHLMLCLENGVRREGCDFPSEQMLPALLDPESAGDSFYFFPLHFRTRSFGYCVIRGGTTALESASLYSFMITIGNALEHVRKVRCTNAMVQRLERLYILDALTGIFNRNGFARETREPYQHALETGTPVMVMFADLDGLKDINDHFGHPGGDAALRAVGNALKNVCTGGEIYARFGGDEFLIFAVGATQEHGEAIAKAVGEELVRYNAEAQHPFLVSASIGFCIEVPQPHTSVFQIVAEADMQMYEQKKKRMPSKYLRKY